MRNLVIFFLFFITSIYSNSQAICGFDEVHNKKLKTDPFYRKAVEENEKSVRTYILKNKERLSARVEGTAAALYTIPVVVHVMHTGAAIGSIYNPTDAQIQGAINYLNQVYSGTYPGTQGIGDIQIQFALASKDPSCNTTTGIERIDASGVSGYTADGVSSNFGSTPGVNELNIKNLSRWNPYQYYNIWVVNKIDSKDGTSGTFIAGYAYFPGGQPSYDGTIMLATQMVAGQKTLPHEIGHAFGLYHTFQGSTDRNTCPANTDCSIDGDRVCDTDPESYNQLGGVIDFSCRTGINSCTGTAYSINTESNYMNYTNCYNLFTAGQKSRMLAFAASSYRSSLTTSMASNSIYPLAVYTTPLAASCSPTTSVTGLSGGYAGILSISLNGRTLGSSLAMYDNGYLDGTTSCLNLIQLLRGNTYSFSTNVAGINHEQLRAWIDFNNDGTFDNITEQIIFADPILKSSPSASSSFTVPATAVINTMLRMRVIDEASTVYGLPAISSGCTNSTYGQAEDYPVYITSASVLSAVVNYFNGILQNNTAVLSWNASGAENLKSFEVEKSMDGIHFFKIATVDPGKKAAISHDYVYRDNNLSESNYYRLRIVDQAGIGNLSDVVLIRLNDLKEKPRVINTLFKNYVDFALTKEVKASKLQLINSVGLVVAEKEVSIPLSNLRWELPWNLPAGGYIIKIIVEGETFTYKAIKQ